MVGRFQVPAQPLAEQLNTTATLYYKNIAFTWWEWLPAARNNFSMVLLRYSRLEAAPTKLDNPVKQAIINSYCLCLCAYSFRFIRVRDLSIDQQDHRDFPL